MPISLPGQTKQNLFMRGVISNVVTMRNDYHLPEEREPLITRSPLANILQQPGPRQNASVHAKLIEIRQRFPPLF